MKKFHLYLGIVALLSYFVAILSFYRIFYIAIVMVFFLGLFATWVGPLQRRGIFEDGKWLFIFFAYSTLTALWAQYPTHTLTSAAVYSIFLVVWAHSYLLARNNPEASIVKLFVILPYVVLVVFIYALGRYGALRPYDVESTVALGATANDCALWLGVSLPFISWQIRQGEKKRYFELFLALLLIAVAESRAGYGLAVFCLFSDVLMYGKNLRQYAAGTAKALALLVLIVCLVLYFPTTRDLAMGGLDRLLNRETSEGGEVDVDVERLWTYEQGWEAFIEHPFLGVGFDNIGQRVLDAYGYREVVSHNLLITLVSETGWPGLMIFIVLARGFFIRVNFARKSTGEGVSGFYGACSVSMVAILLSGMLQPMFQFPLFYVVLGIGYAAGRKVTRIGRAPLLQPIVNPA